MVEFENRAETGIEVVCPKGCEGATVVVEYQKVTNEGYNHEYVCSECNSDVYELLSNEELRKADYKACLEY